MRVLQILDKGRTLQQVVAFVLAGRRLSLVTAAEIESKREAGDGKAELGGLELTLGGVRFKRQTLQELDKLLSRCWSVEPAARPTADEVFAGLRCCLETEVKT